VSLISVLSNAEKTFGGNGVKRGNAATDVIVCVAGFKRSFADPGQHATDGKEIT